MEKFDYIIVGAGTAGSLLANRLSNEKNKNILLVEAGGWDNNFWTKIPIGYYRLINNPKITRHFFTEPEEGTAGRSIDWPRGRIIGGSSSVNGLIYIRGQKEDFDKWESLGAKGWGYNDVLPYFKKIENFDGKDSQYRGKFGEIKVSNLRKEHPFCNAWMNSAMQLGYDYNDDFNGETTLGIGKYDLNIGKRWRSSSSAAFLHPVKKRENLKIYTDTFVEKITFENRKTTGIIVFKNGKRLNIKCNKELILCAGAIQSPQILQLSGIGPEKLLKKFNIPVIVNSKYVGKNLQDHFQSRLIVEMKDNLSLNNDVRRPLKLISMGLNWLFRGKGDLTVGGIQIGGGVKSKYAVSNQPDIQLGAMPFSVDRPGVPLHKFSGFTTLFWQCHPLSRGTIEIKSIDPQESPKIMPSYLSHELDRKTMIEGVKLIRKIHSNSPMKELIKKEVAPGTNVKSDDEILEMIKKTASTVYHPSGTCKMGESFDAVVDTDLRVKGVFGLRVVDASVMPTIVSANTNAATFMIAEKISEKL